MGLLDMFGSSWEDPKTQAILAMSQGLLSQRGMPGLLSGMQGYVGTMAQAKERERMRAMEERKLALEEALKNSMISENQAQAQQRLAAAEEARRKAVEEQRIAGVLRGVGGTIAPIQANAASGVMGPRPEALQVVGQRRPIDYQELIRQGVPAGLVEALAKSADYGRPEVARVEETTVNGAPVRQQFDRFGGRVGDPLAQWKAPVQVGQGDRTTFVDPITLRALGSLGINQSPDALLSASTARRGQDMTDARSRESNAITAQNGRLPPGYRWTADGRGQEPIPGGPADIKAGELGDKRAREQDASVSSTKNVLDTITEAKNLAGWKTAGVGGLTASIPMTDARELAGKLQTIKANLGFDRLQEMRRNSPTGGALGQVAVQELNALQATVASLDQLQSPAALARALDKAEQHYKRWLEVMGGSTGGASSDFGKVKRYNPETGRIE